MDFLKIIIRGILFTIAASLALFAVAIALYALPNLFSGEFSNTFFMALFVGAFASFYGSIPLFLSHFPIYFFRDKRPIIFIPITIISVTAAAILGLYLAINLQSANAWEATAKDLGLYCSAAVISITALSYFLVKSAKNQ